MKQVSSYIKLQIPAGTANPSPPVGPALGQKGINIIEFCKSFNSITVNFEKGTPIPVIIEVYSDKTFNFTIKQPPTVFLLKQAISIDKGSKTPSKKSIGKIHISKIKEIAKIKFVDMTGSDIEANIKSIIGTARSMGIEIEE